MRVMRFPRRRGDEPCKKVYFPAFLPNRAQEKHQAYQKEAGRQTTPAEAPKETQGDSQATSHRRSRQAGSPGIRKGQEPAPRSEGKKKNQVQGQTRAGQETRPLQTLRQGSHPGADPVRTMRREASRLAQGRPDEKKPRNRAGKSKSISRSCRTSFSKNSHSPTDQPESGRQGTHSPPGIRATSEPEPRA